MSDELRSLYQEMIVDHGRHPRNFKTLDNATHTLEGFNPLCGDQLKLFLVVENAIVKDVAFTGQGCAISMASASIMSQMIKDKTVEQAQTLFENFHRLVTQGDLSELQQDSLGKLQALAGVKAFPSRIKCATLAWHTLSKSLAGKRDPVSTE